MTEAADLFVWFGAGILAGTVRHFVTRISHTTER